MDGVSKICTKTFYSAFDNEKCTEVAWIEYRDVPRSVMDRFEESLARLLALDHPNLVKYHCGWADRKSKMLVLITEQVTGDLRNWLVKKIEMAPKVYQRWIRQLCGALDYLHNQNWVHPDIATNKIFIRGTGELKIGGMAEAFFDHVHFSDKTFQAGIGAPELAMGVKAGPRQNVYQLGMCALHVFTFHHPFKGKALPEIIKMQLESPFPPELEGIKEKDEVLYDLLSGCLSDLENRISLTDVLVHPYLFDEAADAAAAGLRSPPVERIEAPVSATQTDSANSNSVANINGNVSTVNATVTGAAVALTTTNGSALTRPTQRGVAKQIIPKEIVAPIVTTLKAYIGPKSPDAPCIRVRLNGVQSLEELRNIIEEDFREEHLFPEEWTLKYRDVDNDIVMITHRTTLEDVLEFAVHLELLPLTKKIPTNLLGDLLNQSDFLRISEESPGN